MGRSVSWGLAAIGLAFGFTVVDAHAQSFTGPGITVSGTPLESVGSSVSVGGISGTLSSMSLQFNNLNVTNLNNIAVVLVSPDGHALDLLSGLCGQGSSQMNSSTFTLVDTNATGTNNDGGYLPGIDQSITQQGTCPSAYSGTYLPTDYWAPDFDTFNSPGPSSYSAGGFPGTPGDTFATAFASSMLNGTWTLYIAGQGDPSNLGPGDASGSLGSWTLTIATSGGASASTTTSLSSNASGNETTIGTSVALTATVTSFGSAVSAGTVTFTDNGNTLSACSAVALNGSGQATCIATFSAEGSHPIVATYNPGSAYIGSTSSALNLFIDHVTTNSSPRYCNTGGLSISSSLAGSNNPTTPYPSHIKVSGYSGNISGATLTLNGFSDANPGQTAMLLVGPTGTNIVPWLNVGGSNAVNNITFTLADSAGSTNTIPSPPVNGDTYYPTAILLGAAPVFPPPAPTPYQLGPPPGDAGQTFTSAFNGINPNGYWSLYIYNTTGSTALTASSWCVNLLSQPALSLSLSHTGSFTQGDTADTYTMTVANNAASATSTELTLTDSLPTGMSAVSFVENSHSGGGTGSDWSCTGASCTRSTSMPSGEQDTLTLTVGVGYGTSFGTDAVTNSASFTDGASNTANATDPTTITPGSVQVTFNTNPAGLTYSVNGTPFSTQQTQAQTNGSNVSLSTTSPQTLSSTDYVWSGWSDGGDISHSATISSTTGTATYTASFGPGYALTTSANPSAGGAVSPASGSYSGVVDLTATPNTGWAFTTWTGAVANANSASTTITMNAAQTATANFAPNAQTTVWIVNSIGGLSEITGDGVAATTTPYTGGNTAVAIDATGNLWSLNSSSPLLYETNQLGTQQRSISSGTGGLNAPVSLAIDGGGQVWVTNGNSSISLFSNAGATLSPSGGFTDSSLDTPSGIAVDLGGSVWIANRNSNTLTRILGAAAPAAPLSTAAKNNTTGARP